MLIYDKNQMKELLHRMIVKKERGLFMRFVGNTKVVNLGKIPKNSQELLMEDLKQKKLILRKRMTLNGEDIALFEYRRPG